MAYLKCHSLILMTLYIVWIAEGIRIDTCRYSTASFICDTKIYIDDAKWKKLCDSWYTCTESSAKSSVRSACHLQSRCDYNVGGGSCRDLRIWYYCAVHGDWTNWGNWGGCTLTCGGGSKTRTRSCTNPPPEYGGDGCSGSTTSSTSCQTQSCPIDGDWSKWGGWGPCSVTCGGGTKSKTRTCTSPSPQHGGADCSGSSITSSTCKPNSCPIDGGWTSWSSWTSCSVTCGGATITRSRSCTNPSPAHGGSSCSGSSTESTSCNTNPCPIDGVWTSWSNWYSCSVTCEGGIQYKYRYCTNPRPQHGGADCIGTNTENQICNTLMCPIDGYWNTWQPWQSCSKTCDTGSRTRVRVCDNPVPQYNGKDCEGSSSDAIDCNLRYCPTSTLEDCGNPSDGLLMYSDVNSLTTTLPSHNDYIYFMLGIAYEIDCCGLIRAWKIYPKRSGTLEFMVWKLVSGNTYELKASQSITLTDFDINTAYTYDVPSDDRISIINTDRVAWRTSGSDMLPYYTCDSHNILWCPDVRYGSSGSISVGQQLDVSTLSSTTTRAYAFKAYSVGNTPIAFSDSILSVDIPDNTERMTELFTYTLTGVDTGEIPVFTWSGDTDYFYHNISSDTTGEIYIKKDFEAATVDDSYQSVVEVEDACSTSTITFRVTVYDAWWGCDLSDSLMYKEPDELTANIDTDSGKLYMLMDEVYDIKCIGLLSSWQFYPSTTGDIDFIIYYFVSGTTYKIKTIHSYTVTADDVAAGAPVVLNVTATERTLIQNGDRIGWRCTGQNVIKYGDCDFSTDPECPNEILLRSYGGPLAEDDSYTWTAGSGGVTLHTNKAYAIKAEIVNNTELQFSREIHFTTKDYRSSRTALNTMLFNFTLYGKDVKDEITFTFSDTYMRLDQANYEIKLKKVFGFVSSTSTYSAILTSVDLALSTASTTFLVETYNILDDCGYVPKFGREDPALYNQSADSGIGMMYLMMDDTFVMGCCGVVSAWEFYPKNVGMLDLIVWKKVSGTTYEVKGFNSVEVTADDVAAQRTLNYTVASEFRIALEEYDRIGWRARGASIVGSAPCDILTNEYCLTKTLSAQYPSNIQEATVYQWTTTNTDVSTVYAVGYGFRAHSANNLEIKFSQNDYYAAVANHMPVGTSLMDYEIKNVDYKEVVSITFNHEYMEVNETYGFLQLKKLLQSTQYVETHVGTMYISGSCDHTSSAIFTIDAFNAPPIIRNLPRINVIYEDFQGSQNMFLLDVYDPTNPPDPVCCQLESTKPQTSNFEIKLLNGSFYIRSSEKPQFDYVSVNSYLLYVCCEDDNGTVRNYLQVDIKRREYEELYSPPGWFFTSIIASLIPISIMLLLACALLFESLFFGR